MVSAQIEQSKFIVIEGIDGAGSSTQARMLVDWLNTTGRKAILTAEPTRGPIGALLRQVLKGRLVVRRPDGSSSEVHNDVIALLFAADRLDHLDCEIHPMLADGVSVVSDRYYHSSLLYQSLSGDLDWIRTLNAHARPPDVTYVLDVPAAEAAGRRQARDKGSREIYETDAIQEKLEAGYRRLSEILPDESIVSIDGTRSFDFVQKRILDDLRDRFRWEG